MFNKTILVIEDNPNDGKHMLRALSHLKPAIEVVVLDDGAEALDYIVNTNAQSTDTEVATPEFIFLDLSLPNVDGLDILRQVRAQERTRFIPVVVFTSSKEPSDLRRSYELGANSYICKPIDADEFTFAVQQTGAYWLRRNERPPTMR